MKLITPENIMEIVLESIREIIPYELAVVLRRISINQLKVIYHKGILSDRLLDNYTLNLNKRRDLKSAIEFGEVKLLSEDDDIHEDTYSEIIELPDGHSCMLVPLKAENEIIGLLTLDHRQCDIFTPQKVNIAKSLSKLISVALAQSLDNENLLKTNELLITERNSLIKEISIVNNNLVGNSEKWRTVLEKIKLVAVADIPVMILGETGTGKEEVAKTIHALSNRKNGPFIALNCSALNSNLAESELFGHEKGAFTGAFQQRKGRFELSDKGTLFLDEIGDLPLELQPKLLRTLQDLTFERVGSEKTFKSDVRVICATNVNLTEKIKEGLFREDLFYRLNVFPIVLPPLRERIEDLVFICNKFIDKLKEKYRTNNLSLDSSALFKLNYYSFPGNVRELSNIIERGAILANLGTIKEEHIIFEKGNVGIEKTEEQGQIEKNEIGSLDFELTKIIKLALKKCDGKIYGKNGAAELLKIKPTTLQSKIKKLKIES